MTIQETVRRAQFVVNDRGERTAVFLPMETWQTLLAWIEEQEAAAAPDEPAPIQSLDDLWGDFWPEDEPVDDFIETARSWRSKDRG